MGPHPGAEADAPTVLRKILGNSVSRDAFEDLVERYGPPAGEVGPVLFVREMLQIEPDPWQEKVLRAYGREERRISIRACHGPGKTAVAAWCSLHQLITRYPQNTVVTAPTSGQLEDALVAEVKSWFKKLPEIIQDLFEVHKNRIALKVRPDDSFFSARTAREEKPEALQGVHCDEGWVLLIGDEASGIPESIFKAAAGSTSGKRATTLLLSNATRNSGFFYDTHNKLSDMWVTFRVSAADSPRVTDDFVRDIARRYGVDSNEYRIRVLGEFPLSDMDTIVPMHAIKGAQNRDLDVPMGTAVVWGLDCARLGIDANVLVMRSKIHLDPLIRSLRGKDTMQVAGWVHRIWKDAPIWERPDWVFVDAIGIGAGVADRLRELGLPIRSVNVSESALDTELYRNLRTELWFKAAEWLLTKDHKLPKRCSCDECLLNPETDHVALLVEELAAQTVDYTSTGKYLAAPKKEMRKVLGRSTDHADAFIMTFAGEPATLIKGRAETSNSHSWNKPLGRGLAHV